MSQLKAEDKQIQIKVDHFHSKDGIKGLGDQPFVRNFATHSHTHNIIMLTDIVT